MHLVALSCTHYLLHYKVVDCPLPAIPLQGEQHIRHSHSHTLCTLSDDAHIFQHCAQKSVERTSDLSIGVNSDSFHSCAQVANNLATKTQN